MLTTRPSFEQIAQIPRTTVYLKPLPYTDYVNSPAYASMSRNQSQIETAAEANLRKQQFDKLLADTAKEYGVRPSDVRDAATRANESGDSSLFLRFINRFRRQNVEATSGGGPPPDAPGGASRVRVPQSPMGGLRERAEADPVLSGGGGGGGGGGGRIITHTGDGIPIYTPIQQPTPRDPRLAVSLGNPNRDAIDDAFAQMMRDNESMADRSMMMNTLVERDRVAREYIRNATLEEFAQELLSRGRWGELRGILPGVYDAIVGAERHPRELGMSSDQMKWLMKAARARNARDFEIAMHKTRMTPSR
jgi:hypothetical protein